MLGDSDGYIGVVVVVVDRDDLKLVMMSQTR
jgi:hypothetical protein